MHNASTSLRVLRLLNIKLAVSSVEGAILPSLETVILDQCGGAAGSAVACLAKANSSLVNISFLQCLHTHDVVKYDGTAAHQTGVEGLADLPPAQLQSLHIADAAHHDFHPRLVEVTRLMHERGVFDELTNLRFSDGRMHLYASALACEEGPK